jgi:hypothetical protein
MKRILSLALAFAFLVIQANAAVKTYQITLGSGATQVSTTPILCQWVVIQNNATHSARLGDLNVSATVGVLLASGSPGGSFYQGPIPNAGSTNLQQFYLFGTAADVIDVVCNVIPTN